MNTAAGMPENARVWIYQSNKDFPPETSERIRKLVKSFANQWSSHKVRLPAVGDFLHNRFVVFVVDERSAGVSGCSIDASVEFVRQLAQKVDADFLDRTTLAYLKDDEVQTISLNALKGAVASGEITMSTLFFDNLVKTKRDFETRWLVPLGEGWMKRFA